MNERLIQGEIGAFGESGFGGVCRAGPGMATKMGGIAGCGPARGISCR